MNTAELCWLVFLGVIVVVAVDYVPFDDPGDEALFSPPQHVNPFFFSAILIIF